MDLGKLTALQLAEKIKQHQISVLDGVKYVFDQIEAKEDKVHAYLDTYKKEAYARAKEVQKGIEDGTYTGPLAGVPIAITDMADRFKNIEDSTENLRNTADMLADNISNFNI